MTITRFQTLDVSQTVTIAQNASMSGAIDLGVNTLVGIFMPAAIEATTTNLLFWTAPTLAGTYVQVYDGGTALTIPMAVSTYGKLAGIDDVFGLRFIKISVATAAGVAVPQATALRLFTLAMMPI